jgi:uncharacterized protein DUF6516
MPSLTEYERLIYGLPETYAEIQHSTIVVIRHGPAFAEVSGELQFEFNITRGVWEDLNFDQNVIQGYSYWVKREEEYLYWYDSQPHPNEPSLAGTHPHHKHIPPDIKHHRIPAQDLGFDRPNLPFLIEEIVRDLIRH